MTALAIFQWIDANLRTSNGEWREDERLIVFTEYKTTLDYLKRRLRARYLGQGAIRVLYGRMDDPREGSRDAIIAAFNDPADPVRESARSSLPPWRSRGADIPARRVRERGSNTAAGR